MPQRCWSCPLQRELGQLILKRFLLFVLLLERLATSSTLPSDVPLMFRLDSPIKSSKEVRRLLPVGVSLIVWDELLSCACGYHVVDSTVRGRLGYMFKNRMHQEEST